MLWTDARARAITHERRPTGSEQITTEAPFRRGSTSINARAACSPALRALASTPLAAEVHDAARGDNTRRPLFQPSAVEDADLAATLSNAASILQLRRNMRDALAIRTEHVAENLVRPDVGACTVMGHQQPATQSLLDGSLCPHS